MAGPVYMSPIRQRELVKFHGMDLLQLHYVAEPWKILVSCILLNQTRRKQVDSIIDELFLCYPTAYDMSFAEPIELSELIKSLGFYNRRASTLIKFSTEFHDYEERLFRPSIKDADLTGIGQYAIDAYDIFVLGKLDLEPTDKELKAYLEKLKEYA